MYTAPQAPQSIGGVIDGSIELFKASFRSCWLASLLYAIAAGAIGTWMQMRTIAVLGTTSRSANPFDALRVYGTPAYGAGSLLLMLIALLFNLMLIATIVDVARGREGGNALSRAGTVLAWLPGVVIATILVAMACGIGLVLLVIPGIYLAVRWSVWLAALADERRGAFAALGTSWRLVGGNWWRVTVVLFVAFVVVSVLTMLFGFFGGLVAGIFGADLVTTVLLTQVTSAIGQVLYLPAISSALVAVYLDLKLRKDGVDLEARIGSLGTAQG